MSLEAQIHFRTQPDELISFYGKPAEQTNEITCPLISLVYSPGFLQQLIGLSY